MMYAYEHRGDNLSTKSTIATLAYLKWLDAKSSDEMIHELRVSWGQCRDVLNVPYLTKSIEKYDAEAKRLADIRRELIDDLTDITISNDDRAILDTELSQTEAEQINNAQIRIALNSATESTFSDLQDCIHEYAVGWLSVGSNAMITTEQLMTLFTPTRKNAQAVIDRHRANYDRLNGRARRKALRALLRHEHGRRHLTNYIHAQRTKKADYSRKITSIDVWTEAEEKNTFNHSIASISNAFISNQQELIDFRNALVEMGLTKNERRFVELFTSRTAVEIGSRAYMQYYTDHHTAAVEHNNVSQFEQRRANAQIKAMKNYAFEQMHIERPNRQSELWKKIVNKLTATKANKERLLKQRHERTKAERHAHKEAEWQSKRPTINATRKEQLFTIYSNCDFEQMRYSKWLKAHDKFNHYNRVEQRHEPTPTPTPTTPNDDRHYQQWLINHSTLSRNYPYTLYDCTMSLAIGDYFTIIQGEPIPKPTRLTPIEDMLLNGKYYYWLKSRNAHNYRALHK